MEEILTQLYDYAEQNGLQLTRPKWTEQKIFQKEDTRREMEYKVTQRLMDVLRPLKAHHYQSHSLLYRKAIEFIAQNYHRPIGLSDLETRAQCHAPLHQPPAQQRGRTGQEHLYRAADRIPHRSGQAAHPERRPIEKCRV